MTLMNAGSLKRLGLASAMVVGLSGAAMAADPAEAAPSNWDIAFGVTATSDYISRGASQTEHGAAIQPWAELTIGMLYAGYWGSNVSVGGVGSWESDLSIGIRPTLGPVNIDLGYVHYFYSDPAFSANYGEAYAKASFSPVDKVTLGAAFYVNPDVTTSNYSELNAAFQVHDTFKVSGAVGFARGTAFGDYTTWNAGAAWNPVGPVTLDVRYHDGPDSDKVVFSASIASSVKSLGIFKAE